MTKHPGFYLKKEMDERKLSVPDFAITLVISEQYLNAILSGERAISPFMAMRLADALNVSPAFFVNLQRAYDNEKP